jgi:NhaP-type Na+/H+ or K+/H+ antiporter
MPEYLHNVATLILVFAVFAASNHYSEESGLLAVTVMGLWLANMKNVPVENILNFKESLSILLISGLFILLAARLDFAQFEILGINGILLFLFLQFIARPLKVFISTIGSDLSWQEKTLISWIGPRGIVAAAVTALFALKLNDIGMEQADLLVPMAFSIIIGTVVLQGATSRILAKQLGVANPEDNGYLIIGANPVARFIAKGLNDVGFNTLVTDANWTNIKSARMEGIETYYGNAVSEHADHHLDLVGLGHLITLTPQKELNALAAQRYATEFGSQNIYSLSTENNKENTEQKSRKSVSHDYKVLFADDVSYSKLASLISHDAKLKQTTLSESFTFEHYQEQYGKLAIPLFAFNNKQQLRFFTTENTFVPDAGWTISALIQNT